MSGGVSRFILNETGGKLAVAHTFDCPSIQHQVRGDEYEEQQGFSYDYIGKSDEGYSLVLEKREEGVGHYSARYMTVEDLLAYPRKYRRCRTCAPPVPESPRNGPRDTRSIRVRSLNETHIGRRIVGLGILAEIRITARHLILRSQDKSLKLTHDSSVEYLVEPQISPRS